MLAERGIRIIHQCGLKDYERVLKAYEALGINAELHGFSKELPALFSRSDLAVSRSGASTLWELAANGLPALYVPYPFAAGDHQYHNAAFLAEQGLSWAVRETALNEALLVEALDGDIETASRGLLALEHKDAAAEIMAKIREVC